MVMGMNFSKVLRILCASGACMFYAVAFADTTWKDCVDGKWSDGDKWDNGVPSSDTDIALFPFPAASYTVTYSNETPITIKRIRASQTKDGDNSGKFLLDIQRPMTVRAAAANAVSMYRHGQIHIGEGGSILVDPTSDVNNDTNILLVDRRGSLLHIDGGIFCITNKGRAYLVPNGWSNEINVERPEIRISSGEFFMNHTATSAHTMFWIYGYGKFAMTGGHAYFGGMNADVMGIKMDADSTGFDLSGDAVLDMKQSTVSLGRGTANVGGNAKINMIGYTNTRFFLGQADDTDKVATLNLKDNSSVDMYDSWQFQIGSGSNSRRVDCNFNVSGGVHTGAFFNVWGSRKGETKVNITGGFFSIPRYGLKIAGAHVFTENDVNNCTTGTVTVAGGTLSVTAANNHNTEPSATLPGFIIGAGTVASDTTGCFDGRLVIGDGGVITNGSCPFVVGVGRGVGSVVQTGGELYSSGTFGTRGAWEANPVAIGMSGATGTYVMSGGTSTFSAPVWIGGIETNLFRRSFYLPSVAYCDGNASGTLCVTGGTFKTRLGSDMYLGCDGTGTLQAGGEGLVSVAGNLVLSNAVRSVVKVALRTDRTAPIAVSGKLIVTDAAELEVDVSALGPDEYGKFPLISAASLTGEFDPSKVSVTGGASDGKLVWRTTASGTELCYHRPRGTLLILR